MERKTSRLQSDNAPLNTYDREITLFSCRACKDERWKGAIVLCVNHAKGYVMSSDPVFTEWQPSASPDKDGGGELSKKC